MAPGMEGWKEREKAIGMEIGKRKEMRKEMETEKGIEIEMGMKMERRKRGEGRW